MTTSESRALTMPVELKRQGLSLRLTIEGQATEGSRQPDTNVLKLIAKAFRYQHLLITGNQDMTISQLLGHAS